MKATIAVVCLAALLPSSARSQDEQRAKSPQEIQAEFMSKMRGTNENGYLPAFGPIDFGRESREAFALIDRPPASQPKFEVGTVSVPTLLHKVPKEAQKAHERGLEALNKNDPKKALEELQKAIALDPAWALGHNDLGVLYMALRWLPDAEKEFRRATELDPYVSGMRSNLGWVQLSQNKVAEAEQAARRALAIDRNNDSAKLLLGTMLSMSLQTRQESRYLEQLAAIR